MRTAWLALRDGVHYRREAFAAGLNACGFDVRLGLPGRPRRGDVLVIWNRYREFARMADAFEFDGLPVLVAENATWGNEFAGCRWYSIARGVHNTAGRFPVGGPERWDALGVELAPFRACGEVVGLPQRGIGPPGTAMPQGWKPPGCDRIRPHPGQGKAVALETDLARCGKVVTWGSGAAVKALMLGVRVESHMPEWIGRQDNTDAGRLAMLRRLAWAQWTLTEIAAGVPFRRLLCAS